MLRPRVIPVLLYENGGFYKTIKFKDPKYLGDPVNIIRIFNEKEVDEIVVIDIGATRENTEPDYRMIEELAGECFMPLTYGGGIKSMKQASRIFEIGVEKICIQSEAINNKNFIKSLAESFGRQAIVLSIDLKKFILYGHQVVLTTEKKIRKVGGPGIIGDLVNCGAGELLLNNVDRDGTFDGPDLQLIKQVSMDVDVPVIAVGGVSSLEDMSAVFENGASAVGVGSFFVYYGSRNGVLISYPDPDQIIKLA